jgi:hypothetical protein
MLLLLVLMLQRARQGMRCMKLVLLLLMLE